MSQTSVVSLNPDKGKISIECFQNHSNQLFLGIQKLKSEIKLCDVTLISNIDGKRYYELTVFSMHGCKNKFCLIYC